MLQTKDDTKWEKNEEHILKTIGTFVLPKSLTIISDDTVIFNSDRIPIELDKARYFIDLSVLGHILGTLWVLSIGRELDKSGDLDNRNGMYEHSYGNRLKKTLLSEITNDITYSPGLFEPYFSQYERWRYYGLKQAESRLENNQDALILTLDFKSFYYSVDLQQKDFNSFITHLPEPACRWHHRVNDFVYKVISKYSVMLDKLNTDETLEIGEKHIMPIGFLPSGILAIWVLTPFDNAIIERWNPTYYGRYVDDIIIVDKVEKTVRFTERFGRKTVKTGCVPQM